MNTNELYYYYMNNLINPIEHKCTNDFLREKKPFKKKKAP